MSEQVVRQYPARFTMEEWDAIESGRKKGLRSINTQIRFMVNNGRKFEALKARADHARATCTDCPTMEVAICPRCAALKEVMGDE